MAKKKYFVVTESAADSDEKIRLNAVTGQKGKGKTLFWIDCLASSALSKSNAKMYLIKRMEKQGYELYE